MEVPKYLNKKVTLYGLDFFDIGLLIFLFIGQSIIQFKFGLYFVFFIFLFISTVKKSISFKELFLIYKFRKIKYLTLKQGKEQ